MCVIDCKSSECYRAWIDGENRSDVVVGNWVHEAYYQQSSLPSILSASNMNSLILLHKTIMRMNSEDTKYMDNIPGVLWICLEWHRDAECVDLSYWVGKVPGTRYRYRRPTQGYDTYYQYLAPGTLGLLTLHSDILTNSYTLWYHQELLARNQVVVTSVRL